MTVNISPKPYFKFDRGQINQPEAPSSVAQVASAKIDGRRNFGLRRILPEIKAKVQASILMLNFEEGQNSLAELGVEKAILNE